jgi:hypothetical protein
MRDSDERDENQDDDVKHKDEGSRHHRHHHTNDRRHRHDDDNINKSGMKVDVEVKIDPDGRGRGVFASEDIPEGTKLWRSTQCATFSRERDFLAFLRKLPPRLQCDVLLWAYPYDNKAYLDLDVGSFINHSDLENEINMDCDGYSTRLIHKGEPILMNYTSFIQYDTVHWFDDIRNDAWYIDSADKMKTVPAKSDSKGGSDGGVYHSTSDYNRLGTQNIIPPQPSHHITPNTISSSAKSASASYSGIIGSDVHPPSSWTLLPVSSWMTILPVVVLTMLYGKSLQRKTCVTKDERSTQ